MPQPRLITLQPRSSGPPGTSLTVAALGFDPGRAEIRWNAGDGELLGTANGPDFSVSVTIPQVTEGLYHLVVLARSPSGEIGNTNTVSFEVVAERGAAAPPPQPQSGETLTPSTTPTSISAVLLFAGGGGLVALGCVAGILLSRHAVRSRIRVWSERIRSSAGAASRGASSAVVVALLVIIELRRPLLGVARRLVVGG